ncbi:MAG: tetratricopeptide (TPR) repeat protein [Myxococcota bacterium]|jgi:tetratricopeptide (TPR) repeat protein
MADEVQTEATKAAEVASLLQKGLDAYGEDNISQAMIAWREVMKLDPGNVEALDFLNTADRRATPRPENDVGNRSAAVQLDVVAEARRLMVGGQFEESFELLHRAAEASPFSLELEATIELVRSNLFASYRKAIGDLTGVLTLAADREEIAKYNLPSDAGFLLSLVDGVTDLENMMTVSGMDSFEALRLTRKLIDVGIVRLQA